LYSADVPHPLVDDLNWLLHRVALALGAAEQAAIGTLGIGVREHVVLTALARGGPSRQADLSQLLKLDKSAVTATVDALEEKGLVERRPDPRDRRARLPALTEAGRRLQRRSARATDEVQAEMLSKLAPKDRDKLVDLLAQLAFDPLTEAVTTTGSCL
jgi:DNA-binding MarR family transcriptional regulator